MQITERTLRRGRTLELILVVLFLAGSTGLVVVNPSAGSEVVQALPASTTIQAFAYAMPASGWAPLTVHFSAFGSTSRAGEIVRYDWDLDANGRYDTEASASDGYVSYTYKKAGEYTISLQVTDAAGNRATDTVTVRVVYPGASSVDYWTIFDDSQVRRVELRLTQANWEQMWQDPPSKTRVEADIDLFGETLRSVAVSMKGNASLWSSGEKKSWKIDTDYFVPNQEYHNLKALLFHNNFADASMLREKMGYDMAAFAGVPTGHTAYVEFWIDIVDDDQPSEYWGVYTMVERVDSKFVANRFGREAGIGNLYKADGWAEGEADLAYYGEDIRNYPMPRGALAYGLQTNLAEADHRGIIDLCYVIDGVTYETPQDFAAALEPVFNVDGYLRYLAVIFTHLNLDTYPYTGNNFYLYDDPQSGKVHMLPWDMNNAWEHFGGDAQFPLFGYRCCLGPLQRAPLFINVFEVPQYRQDYAAYVDLLVRHWFNQEDAGRQARAWQALIRPYLTKAGGDKFYVGASAQFTLEAFDEDGEQLIALTGARAAYLRSILDSGQWRLEMPVSAGETMP